MNNTVRHQRSIFYALAQGGFSLVEMMVAMTIGLIVSAGAAALFANTILSTKTLNNAAQIQEAGAYVTQLLGRHLRMAGYADWLSSSAHRNVIASSDNAAAYNMDASASTPLFSQVFPGQVALHGCAGSYVSNGQLANRACAGAATNNSVQHALTVSYQVIADPGMGDAPSLQKSFSRTQGMGGDCNNNNTDQSGSNPRGLFAVNRFYLNGNNELLCKGNGGSAQPIMSNVEQLVITYATAQQNTASAVAISNDLQVTNYKTAAEIDAANEWGKVIAVQVCVLIAGEVGSLVSTTNVGISNKNDCDFAKPTPINIADKRLRQVFFSTVALRNQIHTASVIQP